MELHYFNISIDNKEWMCHILKSYKWLTSLPTSIQEKDFCLKTNLGNLISGYVNLPISSKEVKNIERHTNKPEWLDEGPGVAGVHFHRDCWVSGKQIKFKKIFLINTTLQDVQACKICNLTWWCCKSTQFCLGPSLAKISSKCGEFGKWKRDILIVLMMLMNWTCILMVACLVYTSSMRLNDKFWLNVIMFRF